MTKTCSRELVDKPNQRSVQTQVPGHAGMAKALRMVALNVLMDGVPSDASVHFYTIDSVSNTSWMVRW